MAEESSKPKRKLVEPGEPDNKAVGIALIVTCLTVLAIFAYFMLFHFYDFYFEKAVVAM